MILNIDKPEKCCECAFYKLYQNGWDGTVSWCSILDKPVTGFYVAPNCPMKKVYTEDIQNGRGRTIRVLTVRDEDDSD